MLNSDVIVGSQKKAIFTYIYVILREIKLICMITYFQMIDLYHS